MRVNVIIGLFVSLSVASYSFDCSVKTFTTLSHLMNDPVKEEYWAKQIFPDNEKTAPLLIDTVKIWNKNRPNNELLMVYSIFEKQTSFTVQEKTPYFWIGYPPKEMVDTEDENELHACIGYFYEDRAILVTTISIKETDKTPAFSFLIETVPTKELIERTVMMYEVDKIKDPRSIYALLP